MKLYCITCSTDTVHIEKPSKNKYICSLCGRSRKRRVNNQNNVRRYERR